VRNGGGTLVEGLHVLGRQAVSLLNCTPPFGVKLRKSKENFTRGSSVVKRYSLSRFGCISRDSLSMPARHLFISVTCGGLQSALGRHKCFPSYRTKGFPALSNFQSKLSVSALMWSAKNGIPRPSYICQFPAYQDAVGKCEDTGTVKRVASGRGCGQRTSRSDTRSPS
jgi:hypothetical protein